MSHELDPDTVRLEAFVARGRRAQRAVDEALAASHAEAEDAARARAAAELGLRLRACIPPGTDPFAILAAHSYELARAIALADASGPVDVDALLGTVLRTMRQQIRDHRAGHLKFDT